MTMARPAVQEVVSTCRVTEAAAPVQDFSGQSNRTQQSREPGQLGRLQPSGEPAAAAADGLSEQP